MRAGLALPRKTLFLSANIYSPARLAPSPSRCQLCFLASNLLKVPAGGWFPLVLGTLVFGLMTTWRRGNALLVAGARARGAHESLDDFLGRVVKSGLPRVPGTAIVMARTAAEIPRVLLTNTAHNRVLHERVVIVCAVTKDAPTVPQELRCQVRLRQRWHYDPGYALLYVNLQWVWRGLVG